MNAHFRMMLVSAALVAGTAVVVMFAQTKAQSKTPQNILPQNPAGTQKPPAQPNQPQYPLAPPYHGSQFETSQPTASSQPGVLEQGQPPLAGNGLASGEAKLPVSAQPAPPGSTLPGPAPGTIPGALPNIALGALPKPSVGAPDLGGTAGPGATPNPGGIQAPYALPGPEQYFFAARPDAHRGKQLVLKYGCGQCHAISSIRFARGRVGPPLTGVATRVYIAGVLQNTLENRARWIEDPQAFVPGVVMPNMGLTRTDATDISAFLQTLK